jgi:hypothetical protein
LWIWLDGGFKALTAAGVQSPQGIPLLLLLLLLVFRFCCWPHCCCKCLPHYSWDAKPNFHQSALPDAPEGQNSLDHDMKLLPTSR